MDYIKLEQDFYKLRGQFQSKLRNCSFEVDNLLINVFGIGEIYINKIADGGVYDSEGDHFSVEDICMEDLFMLVQYSKFNESE